MRRHRQRYWFWVNSDDPLVPILEQLGSEARNDWIATILRASLAPGGLKDLITRIDRLVDSGVTLPSLPADGADVPEIQRPNAQELLQDALTQFGWDD